MKAEEVFINQMKAYFTEVEFREVDEKKILFYLGEYKKTLPNAPITIIKEKIKYVNVSGVKLPANEDTLNELAQDISSKRGVSFVHFTNQVKGRATQRIADARREFCIIALEKYNIDQQILKDFFKLDHSTVSYYINGKKFKRLPLKQTA